MKKPNYKYYLKRRVNYFELYDICPFDGRKTTIYASFSNNVINEFEDGNHITSKFKGVKYFYDIRNILLQFTISEAFERCFLFTKNHSNLKLHICKK